MPDHYRVKLDFRSHPKRLALQAALGPAGVLALYDLWSAVAARYPAGNLPANTTAADIARLAQWTGDPEAFLSALLTGRLLDANGTGYTVHDWAGHQPALHGQTARSHRNRENIRKRWARSNRQSAADTSRIRVVSPEKTAQPPAEAPPPQAVNTSRIPVVYESYTSRIVPDANSAPVRPESGPGEDPEKDREPPIAPLRPELAMFAARNVPPKPKRKPSAKRNDDALIEAQALRLYNLYPRLVNRKRALPVIAKAIRTESYVYLHQAVTEYRAAMDGYPEKTCIPHASTWFNAGRWTDDRSDWSAWRDRESRINPYDLAL